jgi:hypothetical protein
MQGVGEERRREGVGELESGRVGEELKGARELDLQNFGREREEVRGGKRKYGTPRSKIRTD